jgi:hypothetical protein
MKIEKVRTDSYNYEVTKFCCKKMKKHLGKIDMVIWLDNNEILIGNKWREYIKIDYCPFCGEKIE